MKRNKAFDKLIGDIQEDLSHLEKDVDSIPDFFTWQTLGLLRDHNFSLPQAINSYNTKIKELFQSIDKLRSKAQNGRNYYKIANSSTNPVEVNQEEDHIEEQHYYSQLIDLLAKLNILGQRLLEKQNNKFLQNLTNKNDTADKPNDNNDT